MTPVSQSPRLLFDQIVESVPEDQWSQFVDEACAGNSMLRAGVMRLLNAHRHLDSFMEGPAEQIVPVLAATLAPPVAAIGSRIGPYKLLEQIGEGGMGIVYVAEQTEPIRRRVALKIIKPGMDSRHVLARFQAERQALAMMDHPNIATVLDAGISDSGRPYFVMELVRGLPITDYSDAAQLTPDRRMELFITVCQAVQHAHLKGIIHRDLKPSNILVTLHDGKPVPKVIDFGISKAIGHELTDHTVYTAFSQMLGTPLYMSPEQAELSGLDIDTRSDVYSLGVLLYELLTGHTPFDKAVFYKAGLDEMRRIIRQDDPPRPSSRIQTLKSDTRTTLCLNRGLDERRLSQMLSGELDWIVMRALEKDRNRRYESASAFACDVRRFLQDEPVLACPQSMAYRLLKFARRHRVAVIVTTIVVTSLVAGSGVATWQMLLANQERIRANRIAERMVAEAKIAAQKTLLAEQQTRRAETAEREQHMQTDRAEGVLYASAIRLAFRHKQAGDDEQAQRLLDAWLPQAQGRDRRGFEWRLLQRQLQIPGKELMRLPGDVSCIRVSPENTYLVAATDGGTIHRYSISSGQPLANWETELVDVRRMEFSQDGSLLAVISYEAEAVLLDTSSGSVRLRCPRPAKHSANPDVGFVEGRLLTTGESGAVKIWNIERGVLERTWNLDCAHVLDVDTSSQRPLVLLTHHETLPTDRVQYFPSLTSTAALEIGPECVACSIAISPDGESVAVGGQHGELEIWDLTTTRKIASRTLTEKINELTFSPNGQVLAAVERSGVAHVWGWRTKAESSNQRARSSHVHWQAHPRPARSVVFAADTADLVTAGVDGRVVNWNWDHSDIRRLPTPRRDCRDILALPGLQSVASLDATAMRVYNLQSGKMDSELKLPLPDASPDSRHLAGDDTGHWLAVAAETGDILCGDLRHASSLVPLPDSSGKTGLARLEFVPGTRMLVAVESEPALWVRGWDVENRQMLFDRRIDSVVPIATLLAHRSESLLALTSNALMQVDLLTGDVRERWRYDGGDVVCMATSRDGESLAIGYKDRTVKLVDPSTGHVRQTLVGHLGSLKRLEFTPDAQTLLALDIRGHLRFWHVASGIELLTWPSEPIQRFDLSANGQWLTIATLGVIETIDATPLSMGH